MKAETMGIWIGKKAMKHRLPTGEETTLVFLDSEGIGSIDSKDSTDATDNQIFTLSVLLSSLLIYNTKNVPTNTDLEKLHFVAKLSDSIRVRSNEDNTKEDVEKFREYSPEFFWLIRDVTLEVTDQKNKPVDIKTYLDQRILAIEKGLSEAVKRRNEIRESIKSFFKSINAFTLPVPSAEKDVLKNMGNPKNDKHLSGEFLVKLDILKTIISEKYHSKKGNRESLLTGTQLADMLESYINALNTKGYIPDWQSTWELSVKIAHKRAGEKAYEIYRNSVSSISQSLPCMEEHIMKQHEISMKEAFDIYRKETLMDSDVERFKENLKQFTLKCVSYDDEGRCCGGLLYTYLTQNQEKSAKLCNDTIDELFQKNLEPVLRNINHQSSFNDILAVILQTEDQYWSRATGPAAEGVFKTFCMRLEKEKEQALEMISTLVDYNEKMEKERLKKLEMERAKRQAEQEKESLQRQKEAQAKQHLDEVYAMQQANERKVKELNEERTRAINEQRQALKNEHGREMENLRKRQENIEAERNAQMQQYIQMQSNLNQQIHQANLQIQQLQNRPPVVVHRGGGGGRCSIM